MLPRWPLAFNSMGISTLACAITAEPLSVQSSAFSRSVLTARSLRL